MTTKIEKCPTCSADAVRRFIDYWEAYPDNGQELSQQVHAIRKAVQKYYLALDNQENGDIALVKSFREIQDILEMHWERGETKQFLDKHPKLKPFYELVEK